MYGHLLKAQLLRQPRKSIFSTGRVTYLQRQRAKEDSAITLYKNFRAPILLLKTSKEQLDVYLDKAVKTLLAVLLI